MVQLDTGLAVARLADVPAAAVAAQGGKSALARSKPASGGEGQEICKRFFRKRACRARPALTGRNRGNAA